jgi:hypothetical protein
MKTGYTWVSILMTWTIDNEAVLTQYKLLKCLFTVRRLVCGVPLLLHK